MDGRTRGGNPLAAGAIVSDMPPSQPQQGQFWIKASTGIIYMWYVDVLGGQWIQPETRPIGILEEEPELQVASLFDIGVVRIDGDTIEVDEEGTISTILSSNFENPNFLGITTSYVTASVFNTLTGATGTVVHNVATSGTTFYHSNVLSDFTANFTNMPLTNNQSTALTLMIDQGSIPYVVSGIQINGNSIPVSWIGGEVPTGTANNIDTISFVALRFNNQWLVVGSLASQGEV
jgi:hypothetical protein